jgi:hypothetical protein
MLQPISAAMSRSESTKVHPSLAASVFPALVLPEQRYPMRNKLFMKRRIAVI